MFVVPQRRVGYGTCLKDAPKFHSTVNLFEGWEDTGINFHNQRVNAWVHILVAQVDTGMPASLDHSQRFQCSNRFTYSSAGGRKTFCEVSFREQSLTAFKMPVVNEL